VSTGPAALPTPGPYEVYGLRDFQPYALACPACARVVTDAVRGAYAVLEPAAPRTCDLFYDGVCEYDTPPAAATA